MKEMNLFEEFFLSALNKCRIPIEAEEESFFFFIPSDLEKILRSVTHFYFLFNGCVGLDMILEYCSEITKNILFVRYMALI